MRRVSFVRRAVFSGAVALCFSGAAAGIEAAQAMPVVPALSQGGDAGALAAVRYVVRHRYPRRAGLYNCGRGGLRTSMSRAACGLNSVGHNGRYR